MDPFNQSQPPSNQLPTPDVDRLIAQHAQSQFSGSTRKRPKGLLLIIGLVVFLLLLGGGAAAIVLLTKSPQQTATPRQSQQTSKLDVSDPLKTSSAYFTAIAKCDLKTTRLLSADKKQRDNPSGFSQNQLTDCQTNVAPIYDGTEYKFFSLSKPASDGSVTAAFRSKTLPNSGDALITMIKDSKSWYVRNFTPQSSAVDGGTAQNVLDSELTVRVDKLAAALEQYYKDHFNHYPTADNLVDDSWIQANLPTLDTAVLFSDAAKTQRINSGQSYRYEPHGCEDATGAGCLGFVITATLANGSSYTKNSINFVNGD